MEGFTYTNIFETKGIEYLVIIAFFAVLIPFWIVLNRKVKKTAPSKVRAFVKAGPMRIPQGLYFSKFHSWAHLDANGEAKVGIDDLLFHFTGDVNIEYAKNPGDIIKKGGLMAQIIQDGKKLNIFSPISGEIKASNPILTESNSAKKENPDNPPWIYSVHPTNWKAETESFYLAEEATVWMFEELTRFKDFIATSVAKYMPQTSGVVLQDGGELADQPLANMPPEVWEDFQEKFLS